MAVVRGKDFKLYVNTAVSPAPDDFLELANVRDVTINNSKALADASTRLSDYRAQVGTLKELALDTQIVYDPTDELFQILQEAFDDDSNLDLLSLDGSIDTIGSKGVRFQGQVVTFTTNQALEDVGLVDVNIVPGYDAVNPPHYVEVTVAGAVTPTASSMKKLERIRRNGRNGRNGTAVVPAEAVPAEEVAAV